MSPMPLGSLRSLARFLPEVLLVCALAALTVAIRYKTLTEIEGGGDALRVWYFARQLHHGVDWTNAAFDHHMARFGMVMPAYLVQLFFGGSGPSYYIAPVAASVGVGVLSYLVAKDVGGPLAGVLASVFIAVAPPMERAGSQILPGVFGSLYVMLAAFALMKYWRAPRKGGVWVGLCAAALFLAYLSHEPCLFFIPGFLYGVWGYKRDKRHALLFAGVLAGLAAIESLGYFAFTAYSSKVAVILAKHGPGSVGSMARTSSPDFWTLFARYDQALETSWKLLLFAFIGAGWALLAYGPARFRGVVLAGFGFLLGMTFTVSSVNPLNTWLSFESRYFGSVAAIATTCSALAVAAPLRRFLFSSPSYMARKLEFALGVAVLLGTLLIYDRGMTGRLPEVSAWVTAQERARHFTADFEKGFPFVGQKAQGLKAVRLVFGAYLPDHLVLRNGQLPSLEEAVTEITPSYFGIARRPEWLKSGAVAATALARNTHCVYKVSIQWRGLAVSPAPPLPKACSKDTFD